MEEEKDFPRRLSIKPLLFGFGIKEPAARSREALLMILDALGRTIIGLIEDDSSS
jgi:hypothetical protein